jgi:hypothetical protein
MKPDGGGDGRGAFLSSIQAFKTGGLRKTESVTRPVSQISDDGDMADQLKKHLEKIRIVERFEFWGFGNGF